jgi:hypothetical protein
LCDGQSNKDCCSCYPLYIFESLVIAAVRNVQLPKQRMDILYNNIDQYWQHIIYYHNMDLQKLMPYGPLPIRILAGITFIVHGLPKFEDVAGTQGFFGSVGIPPELMTF